MSRPPTPIATHSGLRGRPGVELTDAVVERTVAGFVELLARRGLPRTLAVGRDDRPTGRAIAETVIRVAVAQGADVFDLGSVSTPTAKLAARMRGLGGAVVVSGSHLGPDWNGLKLAAAPRFTPVDVGAVPAARRRNGAAGRLRLSDDAARLHSEAVCSSVASEVVRGAGLRVEVTGGAGRAAELLLERLGCRRPEGRADVGLVLDPDGDRLQLADERGVPLDPELTFPLVALARRAHRAVKGADTSRTIDVLLNGRVTVVTPGELHLAHGALEVGADIAGEGNGGVMVPTVGLARDGLAAGAAVLELLARSGRPLSELAAALPPFARRRSTIPCAEPDEARAALDRLADRVGVACRDPFAGVRVERENAWGLARLSATEPVLRLTAEAEREQEAAELHDELRAGLGCG